MDCFFLIPHAFEQQILLVPQGEGFSLPRWTLPATWFGHPAHEHQRASLLNQAVHEQFGLTTTVLLITRLHDERLVIFNTLSDSPLLPGRWVSTGDIASLPIIDSERHILEAWFAEEGKTQHTLMPWQRHGWFAEPAAWIAHQVERQGWLLQTPVEQLYTKYGACMLGAATTGGIVYLKALPPSFAREPRLMAYLARHFPHLVPRVLAIDEMRNWLLMQQAPGTLLYDLADVIAWEHTLRMFAELQIACVNRQEDLLAIGCPDLRLSVVSAQLEPMLNDQAAMHMDQPGGLSSEQVARLRTRVPQLQAACQRLADGGIPETLEHGDFGPINVLVQDEQITYLDWTDASLTHPFFSALRLLIYCLPASLKERHPDLATRLRTAYLEPWTIYAPMDHLMKALDHATIPMRLHRALNYSLLDFTRQNILWERSIVAANALRALAAKDLKL